MQDSYRKGGVKDGQRKGPQFLLEMCLLLIPPIPLLRHTLLVRVLAVCLGSVCL